MANNDLVKVEISRKTIFFATAFLISIWFIIQIKEIIILVFLSVILVAALLKPVEWLTNKKIPRVMSVAIVYLGVVVLIAFAIGIIVPPLIDQTTALSTKLPQIIASVNDFFIFAKIPVEDLSTIASKQLQQFVGNIVAISSTILSSILLVLTIFVLTFYLLLDWNKFIRLTASPFSGKQEKRVINVISKIEKGLGRWLRGQLALSFIVGTLTFVGLQVLGIPYALPLALIAGILEIVPIIGPILSSIPAILVALTISPIMALATGALVFWSSAST